MPKSFFIYSDIPAAFSCHFEKRNALNRKVLKLFFLLGLASFSFIHNVDAQSNEFEYKDTSVLAGNEVAQADSENAASQTDTILYKRSIIISRDTIDSWKNDKKFVYMGYLDSLLKAKVEEEKAAVPPSPSFLQMILSSGLMQVIFWLIAIGVVVLVLYKLFLSKGNFIFKRNTSSDTVKEIAEEQPIRDVSDYDALIQQSYKLEDYRMAVRYLFLKTLRLLIDKQLLQHSVDKTNFQYVQEIAADKRNEFASLVLNYEYVWYGNLLITREQYTQVEKKFTSFNNRF
jgi:hypothetical protein